MFKARLISIATGLLTLSAFSACGSEKDDKDAESGGYDDVVLEEYRAAIPSEDRVRATVPGTDADSGALKALGDAELANLAVASAVKINLPAVYVVTTLRAITAYPPTTYDSETKEFVWGPWDNDDGFGQVLVYIRENPSGDDMKYGYALVRLVDSDLATASPVIMGGATPDPDDENLGVGITLWDFEANNAFDEAYDPDYDPAAARDEGRFAMLYGQGDGDDGEFAFNVAVFRDFVPEDAEPGAQAADLDYFYGRFDGDDGNTLDFVDWNLTANLCESDPGTCFQSPAAGEDESLNLRAAFFNRGMGRGEAEITGGDLSDSVSVVECWDDDIDRTYVSATAAGSLVAETGECSAPFDASLEDLGIPSLDDVDPDLMAALDCVAANGMDACQD